MRLFLFLALAVAVFGWIARRRIHQAAARGEITEEMIHRIEHKGELDVEDPLDLEEARAEEDRFWSQTWDEPEEL